ncbi:unnamed protein product [Paramecium pentaurelia]|uniref:Transmembrane protein n=1 Tax=Paramecium pentaurelia TaxID=43138 RepID=A0A8S1WW68_9CILI|nr:unnamed protein product [Paramecium pentaurelia]
MTLFFHRILDKKLEKQFTQIQNQQTITIQHNQKVLILLLLLIFAIQKGLENNWSSFAFNAFGLIFIIVSYKYVNKTSIYYKYLLLVIVELFNFFYPFNRLMKIPPNQDTYLDGYFICLGTLAIINSFDIKTRYLMLIPIFGFNLAADPHESNLFWSQVFKFSLMILLDIQYKIQQEIIKRKQFLKLSCKAIVQSFIEKEQMIETFQVQYCDDSKQIQLINQKTKQRVNEFQQIDFKQKIRNVIIRPKSKRLENLIEDNIFNFSGKLSLELFLFYFLNKTQKVNDARLVEFLKKHKQKVELDGMIDETLNQIVVYKLHHHTHPQALVIIKQLQAKTQVEQLKLKYENQNLIIKYLMNILNCSLRLCMNDAAFINQKTNLQKLSFQVQTILFKQQSQLIKAWNQFTNLIDFVQLSCNVNPLTSFNIIQLINSVIQITKNLIPENNIQIELINKLKCQQIYSNSGKVRQLFFNLIFYIFEKNPNQITITLLEEQSDLNNTFTITINYKSQIKISKSELHHFPIINPLKFKDFKHNIKNSMYLEIPISIFIVRLLGPKNKIIMRKQFQECTLQFSLYKLIQSDMQLQKALNLKSENQIIVQSEIQPIHTQYISIQHLNQQNYEED